MTTAILADLTPHHLTPEDCRAARSALTWALDLDAVEMLTELRTLSPEARRDVLLSVEVLAGSLAKLVEQDGTALPDGVDGHRVVGGRS